uniref:Uncharacterized protein n=1 Tax=Eptatretus burgeri TaxID=7764 RepID=A0A8C4QAV6_EPTBU
MQVVHDCLAQLGLLTSGAKLVRLSSVSDAVSVCTLCPPCSGLVEQGREERAPTSRNVVSRLLGESDPLIRPCKYKIVQGSRLFHTTCRKYFHRIFHGTRDCVIPACKTLNYTCLPPK